MTRHEHLLVIAMEECNELAQRLSKALRFGLEERQPAQPFTNTERLSKSVRLRTPRSGQDSKYRRGSGNWRSAYSGENRGGILCKAVFVGQGYLIGQSPFFDSHIK